MSNHAQLEKFSGLDILPATERAPQSLVKKKPSTSEGGAKRKRARESDDELKVSKAGGDASSSKLAPELVDLMKMLFNVEAYRAAMMEFDINLSEMTLEKLSFEALTQIQNLLKSNSYDLTVKESLIVDANNNTRESRSRNRTGWQDWERMWQNGRDTPYM